MRRRFPRVATAFDLYLQCRQSQMVHLELTKDKGKKVEHKIVSFSTGLHHLPEPGGILDQPCWTFAMFTVFRNGENVGAQKTIK